MAFVETLPELRDQHGLTQQDLAEKVSAILGRPVLQSTISFIESGKRQPSWLMVQAIAEALGVTLIGEPATPVNEEE